MNAVRVSALLAALVARPASPLFPPWRPPVGGSGQTSWGPEPAGPSGRSTASGRDSSDGSGTQSFTQSQPAFTQSQPVFTQSQPVFTQSQPAFPQSQPAFTQSQPAFPQSQPAFLHSQPSFSQVHQPFSQGHQSPSHSSSPFQPSQPHISSFSSFSPPSPSFQQPPSLFSQPSHISTSSTVSGFGPPPETTVHSTQQHKECPYGTVCVDEYLCPPYGRSAGGVPAGPRTFNAFHQPISDIYGDKSHGSAPHDSTAHGHDVCGHGKICCDQKLVTHHHQHSHPGGPGHCHGPHCQPPHLHHGGPGYGGYGGHHGGHHGGYGGHHGGYGHHGHQFGGHLTHPVYLSYPHSHSGGYHPHTYPQSYGYPQYPSYHDPYYPPYEPYQPLPYPSYPPFPFYPPYQPHFSSGYGPTPYAYSVGLHGHGHHGVPEDDGKGSDADDGHRRASPASRTSRIFAQA